MIGWPLKGWETLRPILTNKRIISGNAISLFEGEKLVSNESIVAEIFNILYINVLEKSSGIKPTSVLDQENTNLLRAIFVEKAIIVEKYSLQSSVIKIKKNFNNFILKIFLNFYNSRANNNIYRFWQVCTFLV